MTVFLVGAGPGDPGLLTVRAAQLLARADVVVYDRLSVATLLDLAPPRALRISVGKTPRAPGPSQDDINALLVEHGRTAETVVRLKGGDPFVFARGGEECAALAAAGIGFEVVPGITSAIAAPAYAGIPVTMRHSSTSFTVVTGHEDPAAGEGSVHWEAIAKVGGTIVILMGVATMARIAERLMAGGLAPDTPAAAVTWGTRPGQVSHRATLATIAARPVASPAVYVIGGVAATDLAWFERRPLFGRTVVVTRTRAQASTLVAALRELGAEVVALPTIRIEAPTDGGAALRAAVAAVAGFDWLVLTSPNGVERTFAELPDTRALGGVRVAAIGAGTAAALARYRVVADLVPERFVAESLLAEFPPPPDGSGVGAPAGQHGSGVGAPAGQHGSGVGAQGGRRRGRVLLARAAVARDVLPEGLRAMGWEVEVVEAYRSVADAADAATLGRAATADAITFTSSSTVERYLALAGADGVPPIVACIGPVTAATARAHGLRVDVEAPVHTVAGLVDALVAHLTDASR